MTYIYGLKDPDTQEIRYIGKSNTPKTRYYGHLALHVADVNLHKKRWIAKLREDGKRPELVILEKVKDEEWEDREKWWIKYGRDQGWKLTNIAEGGSFNVVNGDSTFELIEALSLYVDESTAARLPSIPFERLHAVALYAAIESTKLGHGYFSGKNDGSAARELMRKIISSEFTE